MRLAHLSVNNFKALRNIEVPLSRFVCVIGENNAGKSSLLQALLLFVEGRKIDSTMYFDSSFPILIAVRIDDITEKDLELITNEEHRDRFREIVEDGSVTLVRRYEPDGSSRLRWIASVPIDERFGDEFLDKLLKGKRAGSSFLDELRAAFPEIESQFDVKTNLTQARKLIEELAKTIPKSERKDEESDLRSGIDNSIRPLLPEPIYVAAVKDLADDIATKDSASFGKLLGILLHQIAPDLQDAEQTFEFLKKSLNRVRQPDGSVSDTRLEAVRNIETVLQTYVQQNFPLVQLDLRIPPPEIKTVLSGAEIWVDDGVLNLIDSKGDGLKRTVTFSILRAYVALKRRMQSRPEDAPPDPINYLFLFEEPELYLHPAAQGVLFDVLSEIALTSHVVVSTHSPLFFGPDSTGTFIKLGKTTDLSVGHKPFSTAVHIDLADLDNKSRFQIISYETNNTAFFYRTVVLVEGESDLVVLPHIARILNKEWAAERASVAFCRVGGKGNIARYRDFFRAFEARVCVVGDLDCILEGFEQLNPSEACTAARNALLAAVDEFARVNDIQGKTRSKDIREMQESQTRQEQFASLIKLIARFKEGRATTEEVQEMEDQFFSDRVTSRRRQILEGSMSTEITFLKRELLKHLRGCDAYILERGSIDSYFPTSVDGPDKPSKAMNFCARVQSRDEILQLCDHIVTDDLTDANREFSVILSAIYDRE